MTIAELTMPETKDFEALSEPQKRLLPEYPAALGKSLAELFRILGDDTRMRILYFLYKVPELNVRALCDQLTQSQPAVSHHLAMLKKAGFLESRREGKNNYYRLRNREVCELLNQLLGIPAGQPRTLQIDASFLESPTYK
jgi:ArsR family transcriptional regulator, arsenate/arsenite/antimonite-responsive transcriptional repressor